jgi:hypothetical protein
VAASFFTLPNLHPHTNIFSQTARFDPLNAKKQNFFYPFPHGTTAPSGPGPPHYRVFTITLRNTTLGRTPLDECSARRKDLYMTTDDTHSSKQAVADPRLRPRSHRDRPFQSNIPRFPPTALLEGSQVTRAFHSNKSNM